MEIIRVVPPIVFLLFCWQVTYKTIQLKNRGILTSQFKITLKTVLSTLLLLVFTIIFLSELIAQSVDQTFAVLPEFLRKIMIKSKLLALLGVLFLVFSVVTMYLTLVAFNNSLRFGLQSKNLGKLVTKGIFTYSRNPFFLSILFLFFGILLVFPTPFFVAIFVLSFISIHFFILKEEKFMLKNYGEEYAKYAKKVRRYF